MIELVGRDRERRFLDQLLGRARQGRSGALIVRGAPGVGKTKLLDYAVDSATGFRVMRTTGVEAETELDFATLQVLCNPLSDRLGSLPEPQAQALQTSLGMRNGPPPTTFLIGLAVLSLMSDLSDEGPVLLVVDDAHWLDPVSRQVLGFVARRLEAEAAAILFGAREAPLRRLDGLPELALPPLSATSSRMLLGSALSVPLDVKVRDRIVAEAQGNPLALLELPRTSAPADVAGGFAVPRAVPSSVRVEDSFRRRVNVLPAATRRLLLLAAAEPLGDPDLFWAAADRLGLRATVLAPAAADGLLSISTHVAFRHPIVRSVVYDAADRDEKRLIHDALAAVTNRATDPDRKAWHRALASENADERVALELEGSAERAHARGGLAAEAAFMERAAALTPDGAKRCERALAAAEARLMVGSLDAARDLLELARQCPMESPVHARLELVRAQVENAAGSYDSPGLLLRAAERLAGPAPELSRETYLAALEAAARVGRLSEPNIREVAIRSAKAAPPAADPPRPVDLLLDGYVLRYSEGDAAAAPAFAKALAAFRDEVPSGDDAAMQIVAMHTAAVVRDEETWAVLATRLAEGARTAGALPVLSSALEMRAAVEMFCGQFDRSARLIHENETIVAAAGGVPAHYAKVVLAALRGRERETMDVAEMMVQSAGPGEEGWAGLAANMALSIPYNALGRYASALEPALRAFELDETFFGIWAAPEVIEAATRSGKASLADEAVRRLTAGSGVTDWGLGVRARALALISGERASPEDLYVEAIECLSRTPVTCELARAHLLYGEWLRRARRRTDARSHLRTAYDMFAAMPGRAFAERAARELKALGVPQRPVVERSSPHLTSQQMEIALLACDGRSNQEIAAQLFISPRTVEYHLRNIFIKLGIASRNELRPVLERHARPVA